MSMDVAANSTHRLVKAGWTRKVLGKQCGVLQIRWEKDGISATEPIALEIQRGEDQLRLKLEGRK
jgi:hypothetical protein